MWGGERPGNCCELLGALTRLPVCPLPRGCAKKRREAPVAVRARIGSTVAEVKIAPRTVIDIGPQRLAAEWANALQARAPQRQAPADREPRQQSACFDVE